VVPPPRISVQPIRGKHESRKLSRFISPQAVQMASTFSQRRFFVRLVLLWLGLRFQCSASKAVLQSVSDSEPVIGVLSYPSDKALSESACANSPSSRYCFLARHVEEAVGSSGSYVNSADARWLEMAGARAVPILYDSTEEEVRQVFSRVNGVYFTGGPAKPMNAPSPYFETATLLYRLVEEAWARGTIVPLWGTCLGLQTIACIAAGGVDIVGNFELEEYAYPLDFTPAAARSRLFGKLSPAARSDFASHNTTTNWHHYGVSPRSLVPTQLDVLATNRALDGGTFVSALEGRAGLPVYAVQFHPESVQFVGQIRGVPAKSAAAIRTAQYLGNFFVNQARRNNHTYDSELDKALALISQVGTLNFTKADQSSNNAHRLLYPEGAYTFPSANLRNTPSIVQIS